VKKILTLLILSLLSFNISYSGELKAKVIDVKSWPDTAILCKYDTNDQSFMRGFNQINDDILGEFTSVHSFIDNNYWSPIESVVMKNYPKLISWYETSSEMIFFHFFEKDSLSKEYFKTMTDIYLFSDQDKQFLSDMKITKSKNKKSFAEKYAQTDDVASREYTIGIFGIVKKIREQEEKMKNNSAYKKYELISTCKVWK
tara:strand:+ start:42 stop:641 length:600 start_codon:yes stop_codon:yes gene_type:complete